MKVLILGGNGFIGAETVEVLLESGVSDVTVVNRGRSWDWDTPTRIRPRVNCVQVDRDKPLHEYTEFCDFVRRSHFNATVDFSGYSPQAVRQAVDLLTGHTDIYIYISSDSVYEVCVEKQHAGPSRETDAVRPESESDLRLARRRDSYGDEKLSAEEEIEEVHRTRPDAPPYVILRLADVIGPRDSTNRFWQYQLWIEMAAKHPDTPVSIPKQCENRSLSFVFSRDVAQLIKTIIHMDKTSRSNIVNESYNLACTEDVNLEEFLRVVQTALGLQEVKVDVTWDDRTEVPQIFPSVERGPVDISKATSKLQWSPTSLKHVVRYTVDFYKGVAKDGVFPRERKDVYKDLKESLEDLFEKKAMKTYLKETLLLK